MKKSVLLSIVVGAIPMALQAQDDLYFSTDDDKKVESVVEELVPPTYGCDRDVDEYNRRGKLSSYYQKIGEDSLGNDIIEFHPGDGKYPEVVEADTIYPGSETYYDDEGFAYSRRLSRFDDYYGWYDPYYYGYWSPWRYYYGWYDPWYYGYWGYGYWGWYGWNYGWGYPWHRPWWGATVAYRHGHTGTLAYYDRHNMHRRNDRAWGRSSNGTGNVRQSDRGFGTRRNTTTRTNNNNRSFNNTTRSSSSFGSSRGSFGGSRGGSFGGGSRGGGGRVGGRR